MKKKIFLVAGAVLVAAAVSVFVRIDNDRNSMDELFNANVEALVAGESSDSQACYRYCYNKPSSVCSSMIYGVEFNCPDMYLQSRYQ